MDHAPHFKRNKNPCLPEYRGFLDNLVQLLFVVSVKRVLLTQQPFLKFKGNYTPHPRVTDTK